MGTDDGKWAKTEIWTLLDGRDDALSKAVATGLRGLMPEIETVLDKANTQPKDFTLHDADHALRVARRMAEVAGPEALARLSSHELALLLLSAYLHDIGMAPDVGKVQALYQKLVSRDPLPDGVLDEAELKRFDRWLLDREVEALPICAGNPTARDLSRASSLLSHYVRSRHNDWGAQWIDTRLTGKKLERYPDWVADLRELCKSHHMGRTELENDRFKAKRVGGETVNLRFLAALLRVADVMEVDPDRTPDVILEHRAVVPDSVAHWHKDQCMTVDILEPVAGDGARRVDISAKPKAAYIERAVREAADWIDAELALCRDMAEERLFLAGVVDDKALSRYGWHLAGHAHRDVKALDGQYHYIDGSFRPDTKKVLQLLSGLELYGDRRAAVREMLQNAFDAVRWSLAERRLRHPTGADHETGLALGAEFTVTLSVEKEGDTLWLVCRDNGVGMSKAVLRDRFLVSGVSKGADLLDLERRCRDKGFSAEVTGQFGIGVLSYFMLGDRLDLRSKPWPEAGSGDMGGWRFTTDGIGGFGELRPQDGLDFGTELRLALKRKEVFGDKTAEEWFASLCDYLKEKLIRLPCNLKVDFTAVAPAARLSFSPGWARKAEDYAEQALGYFQPPHTPDDDRPDHLRTQSDLAEREEENRWWERLRNEAAGRLRWETREFDLPDGMGRCRLLLPYFQLDTGPCLLHPIGSAEIHDFISCVPNTATAWKGMVCRFEEQTGTEKLERLGLGVTEIDLRIPDIKTGEVILEVSRETLVLALSHMKAISKEIQSQASGLLTSMLDGLLQGRNWALNVAWAAERIRSLAVEELKVDAGSPWPNADDDGPAIAGKVVLANCRPKPVPGRGARWPVSVRADEFAHEYTIGLENFRPVRILAAVTMGNPWMISEWEDGFAFEASRPPQMAAPFALKACAFPPEWSHVVSVRTREGKAFNERHALTGWLVRNPKASSEGRELFELGPDRTRMGDALNTPSHLAWFLNFALDNPQYAYWFDDAYWRKLNEVVPEFLGQALDILGVPDGICMLQKGARRVIEHWLTRDGTLREGRSIFDIWPSDPDWVVDLTEGEFDKWRAEQAKDAAKKAKAEKSARKPVPKRRKKGG